MATLEERVSRLEEQMHEVHHRIEAGLGSHALAIGLVHRDTQELLAGQARLEEGQTRLTDQVGRLEEGQTRLTDQVGRLEEGQTRLTEDVATIRRSLDVILSRLPE